MTVECCCCLPNFEVRISPSYPAHTTLVASKKRWTWRCGPQCTTPPVQGSTFSYFGLVRLLPRLFPPTEHVAMHRTSKLLSQTFAGDPLSFNTKARHLISTSARLETRSKTACSIPCRAASDWTVYERRGQLANGAPGR